MKIFSGGNSCSSPQYANVVPLLCSWNTFLLAYLIYGSSRGEHTKNGEIYSNKFHLVKTVPNMVSVVKDLSIAIVVATSCLIKKTRHTAPLALLILMNSSIAACSRSNHVYIDSETMVLSTTFLIDE